MRTLVAVILVSFLATACSEAEPGGPPQDERTRRAPAGRGTASWDYVALGDSLAAGVGAERGYVDRYAAHLRNDTGARVRVSNLGVGGQTSSELLDALREDESMRGAIEGAEVVTFNIGLNDLGRAGAAYEEGTCGGEDGEECLRKAVDALKDNWDAIAAELLELRSTGNTIIRTPGLGYTPRAEDDLEHYVSEVNRHIASTARSKAIPHVEIPVREVGMSPDGIHPNDAGYATIAERLRGLGFGPLRPR
ncbi:MAG: SGNH/GDSL hydrolase family protein [Actinomycetota bacterium]|nr:SGNH/GDSL hydrolase family protein [Actinomycetota bacterium]